VEVFKQGIRTRDSFLRKRFAEDATFDCESGDEQEMDGDDTIQAHRTLVVGNSRTTRL